MLVVVRSGTKAGSGSGSSLRPPATQPALAASLRYRVFLAAWRYGGSALMVRCRMRFGMRDMTAVMPVQERSAGFHKH